MADDLGFKLGKITSVWESYDQPYGYPMYDGKGGGIGGAAATEAAPIQPGTQDVFVNVSVTFEIK